MRLPNTDVNKSAENKYLLKVKINRPPKVIGINLSKSEAELNVGNSYTLTYTILPQGVQHSGVTFETTDSSVATVTSAGIVTAIGNGHCSIIVKAKDTDYMGVCQVRVVTPVTSVNIAPKTYTFLNIGESQVFTGSVSPTTSEALGSFSSSDANVVMIDNNGLATATGYGKATITYTAGGKTSTANVIVGVAPTSITLKASKTLLTEQYEAVNIQATITPEEVTNSALNWTSTNPSIATVSETGVVTALATGVTVITATSKYSGLVSSSIRIEVSIPPKDIKLSLNSIEFTELNQNKTLVATVLPEGCNNTTVTWTSNDTNVATVTSSGVVTSKGVGTCIITATNSVGKTSTCTVTVNIAPTSMTLSPSSITLDTIGKTAKLIGNFEPSYANVTGLSFSSSNTSIVTVERIGL